MKRKLTVAMLLSLSAASPLALALGLGEAEVNSTLSAPLRASIPLTDSAGLQADLLDVSVADDRSFAAAGLSRTPLAASVKMDVTRRQGRLVLDLTTERAVREPWIDLLLRFEWPGGQQLREVTLLLDPPDYDRLPALVAGSSTTSRESVAVPRSSSTTPEAPSRPVARPSAAAGAGDPAWVRSGDTLWAIAGRLRPDSGISMNQMMIALVEANPEVFPSGNINAMRAGFTLVVPPREAVAARSEAEAGRLVQAMNQAWANRGSGAPARVALGGAAASPGSAVAGAAGQEAAPTASPDDTSSEPTTAEAAAEGEVAGEAGPRLTLLSDAEIAAAGGPSAGELSDAPGAGAAAQNAPGDIPSLALSPGVAGEGPVIDPEVLALIQGGGELTEDERLLRLEARWQESREVLEAVRSERDELQGELGDLREELEAMRDQLARLTAGGSGVDAAGAGGVVAPGSESPSAQQAPWWGALYQASTDRTLMLGGAGLAALLALWALVRRRRRREESPAPVFNEAQPVDPAASGVVMPGATQAAAAAEAPAAGPSEEQKAPVRASMPEAEAINEADIFIAYGRYDQARELLEASLVREPGRDDLRLKLLGVQLEQGDQAAAARQAEQLRAGGDPDVLAEVARLMKRHVPSAATPEPRSSQAAEAPVEPLSERAVFPDADELPPRRFDHHEGGDEGTAAGSEEAAPGGAAAGPSVAPTSRAAPDMPAAGDEPADPMARYRPPELESASESSVDEGDAPDEPASIDAHPDPLAGYRPPDLESADESPADEWPDPHASPGQGDEAPPRAPVDESPLETVKTDDGRDIIDYRPPTLEAHPAPREETPMQPSVDFTPSGLGDAGPTSPASGPNAGRDVPEGWDVEEVAFPPLSRDNAHFSAVASSTSTMAEARRLLEAGEIGQAQALLESLIDESDDPDARQEARELLDQHLQ